MRSLWLQVGIALLPNGGASADFKSTQLKYARVKQAYRNKGVAAEAVFRAKSLAWPPEDIFWRAFKLEKRLELWGRDESRSAYVLLKTYDICQISGTVGPKREQGDYQIPEGFYHLTEFNPVSQYHLSLRVNYPNASDRILGGPKLGGDIFIHGECVTIGCLPMTNDVIEEIYVISLEAKHHGQKNIPIHVFPMVMHNQAFESLLRGEKTSFLWESFQSIIGAKKTRGDALIRFWKNLKEGYDYFESKRRLPRVTIAKDGRYVFE